VPRSRSRQAVQGGQCLRSGVTVDVAVVEAACGEPDLERRDVGVADLCGVGRRRGAEDECDRGDAGDPGAHLLFIGRTA
jgi:hypothetical protein